MIGILPLIAIVAAPCVLWMTGRTRLHLGWPAVVVMAGALAVLARLAPQVLAGETVGLSLAWFPEFGVRYALTLDGLALLFALLISGAGVLILVYSTAYMHQGPELGRFYAYMLLFAGAMLGVVLADDLVLLYVFWELTSLASFFLIGYKNDDPASRDGATQALVVTVAGGVVMLAGLVLLAQTGGTWQISTLIANAGAITADGRYPAILTLILIGAFTKSAQIPFQFWLPGAMVAPTPVSTYLHSATMVWAGVYLLARLHAVLGGTALWVNVVTPVGLATLLLGGGLAIVQDDLKALLAYSTIGALGLAVALVGWGTPAAMAAAMVYVLNHAAFKGALFLVAGAVEHEAGTRRIDRLRGLRRAMPVTMAVAGVAALSLAALPPLGGFLSKEAAVNALLRGSWVAGLAVILSGALSVAYGARFMTIFFGRAAAVPPARGRKKQRQSDASRSLEDVHEPPAWLWAPPAVMALLAIIFGLFPSGVEHLAGLATAAVIRETHGVYLWHGVAAKDVGVTTAALVIGAALFLAQRPARRLADTMSWLSAGRLWELVYGGALAGAKALTAVYMTGRLRDYLVYITVTTAGLLIYGLVQTGVAAPFGLTGLNVDETFSVLAASAAAVAAVRLRLLLGAIFALGVVGYAVSMLYLLLSAPDIALTQVVIETISVVLFIVALTALGKTDAGQGERRSGVDAAVALVIGAVAAILALMVTDVSTLPRIASSFFANAAKAGGTNVVNLIILDFRGWDTLGEISVLAIAGLGIMAMAPWRPRGGAPAPPRIQSRGDAPPTMTSVILQTVAVIVTPLIVVLALRFWWTGHYSPGGGFVGGLMVAAAIMLVALQNGGGVIARHWDRLMAFGMLLAIGSAIVPLLLGHSPMQHTIVYWPFKWASSLIFDMGVLLLVTGTLLSATRSLVEAA